LHVCSKHIILLNMPPAKTGAYLSDIPQFFYYVCFENDLKDINHNILHFFQKCAWICPLALCFSKLTIIIINFLQLRSQIRKLFAIWADDVHIQISEHTCMQHVGCCLYITVLTFYWLFGRSSVYDTNKWIDDDWSTVSPFLLLHNFLSVVLYIAPLALFEDMWTVGHNESRPKIWQKAIFSVC